jgi:hypothetical protein
MSTLLLLSYPSTPDGHRGRLRLTLFPPFPAKLRLTWDIVRVRYHQNT